MSPEALGILQLVLLTAAIFIGFPTAFTLMALGFVFGYLGFGPLVFDLMVQRTFFVMTNDVLISIALFIFMGYVLERSGILDRLFRTILILAGSLRGSLALATVITCTIFAMATGIIGASVTIMGLLALPPMLRLGYDKRLASGSIAAGGTLGILIPPSVLLILYAANAGESIVRLYMAAFVPGFLLAGLYVVYIALVAWWRPEVGPPLPPEERAFPTRQKVGLLLTGLLPISVLILTVLGSIVAGLATPTEAAGVGALGAMVLSAAYRRLTWENLKAAVFQAVRTSSMVLTLLVGSAIFSAVFARLGGSRIIEDAIVGLGLTPHQFIWLMMVVIFLLGWPLEWTEIIIIFMPLFWPIAQKYGIDPIWLGVLVAINLQTAFLSPPVAMAAFYIKGVAPRDVLLKDIWWGMVPFMGLQVVALLLVYFFPQLALWLPRLVYR
ncbi:MAG: TRAP transporter large permease subunit [Armatimonadota bacterium]|nr:TRAP transporter large permease subunit [Armatimonadota bacterium]MDR7519229.1 TRAP transporter large permease subunit [Armatimonadota bacterium]MDR7550322.1 TRAP transporter large permease subunit [Armatimonadota bacterium]